LTKFPNPPSAASRPAPSRRAKDTATFTIPWDVSQRYVRSDLRPIQERTCTENNANFFNLEIEPTPIAEKPDF
jgi:hypothetical protein